MTWLFIIICSILGVLVILYGDPLFASLSSLPEGYDSFAEEFSRRLDSQHDVSAGLYSEDDLAGDFSYTLDSLSSAFNGGYEFRYFSDFILGFFSLVPQRLIPIETPEKIAELNTYLALGHNDFTMPPGILALGIYSMSWLGLAIICFFFGWSGRYLQSILEKHKCHSQPWVSFLYIVVMSIWSELISSGDPALVIRGNSVFFLSFFLIFYFPKRKTRGVYNSFYFTETH